MPLFWKLFFINTAVVLGGAGLLAFTPLTIGHPPQASEVGYLALGALTLLLMYAAFVGVSLQPLAELREDIEAIVDLDDEQPLRVVGHDEVAQMATSFNGLLERLSAERTLTARASIVAQEEERARIAGELHDDIGQTLTFLLLRLSMLAGQVPAELRADVESITAAAREGLDEVRAISRRLRPAALAELGLIAALDNLVAKLDTAGLSVTVDLQPGLVAHEERDLALYRIAQEALSNVVRHAHATRVSISVSHGAQDVELVVTDDGMGVDGEWGVGSYSMRERARVLGGTFERIATAGVGITVRVCLPIAPGERPPPRRLTTRPIPMPADVTGVLQAARPQG